MKAIIIIVVSVFLSFNGCEKEYEIAPLNEIFKLKFGETKTIGDSDLRIRIDSVHDGRCPIEAFCIWEGNATVSFRFSDGINITSFKLNTFDAFQTDTLLSHYRIKLTGLTPGNRMNPPVKPEEYTGEVLITSE
jgi:hypothetical protein